MSSTNITRAEAAERSTLVAVTGYDVHVDLRGVQASDATTFRSTTTVSFTATPGAQTWIDIVAPSLRSAVLNGVPVDLGSFDGTRLALPALAAENVLVVDADCAYMHTGEGLHRFVDPVDDEVYLYSQFETADAKRMFACFDQPDLKATFTLTVTAPATGRSSPTPRPRSPRCSATATRAGTSPPPRGSRPTSSR